MARPAPGVERTIALITFLSRHPDRSFGLSELARRLDLNKATAHAMLATLSEAGWVVRDAADKTYRLGPALVAVGEAAAGPERLVLDLARPHMRRLSEELGVRVVASKAVGDHIIVVAHEGPGDGPSPPISRPGARIPLSPPLGTVFVAWSDPETVERWLDGLSPRPDDRRLALYREAISTIRRRGFTIASDDERRRGISTLLTAFADDYDDAEVRAAVERVIRAIGDADDRLLVDPDGVEPHRLSMVSAPVFDAAGRVCLALTLIDLPNRLTLQQAGLYGWRLVTATEAITAQSGGRPPAPVTG